MKSATQPNFAAAIMAAFLAWGGFAAGASQPDPSALILLHSIGFEDGTREAEESTLRQIISLPETQKLWSDISPALAKSLGKRLLNPDAAGGNAEAFMDAFPARLSEILRREFWLNFSQDAEGRPVISGGIHLPQGSMEEWRAFLLGFFPARPGAPAGEFRMLDFPGSEIPLRDREDRLAIARAGSWLVFGMISGSSSKLSETLLRIRETGRPLPALEPGDWLSAALDAERLFPAPLPLAKTGSPRLQARIWSTDKILRTEITAEFPEKVELNFPEWKIPMEIVRDPLVSFMATRGLASLLKNSDPIASLELKSVPNQVYSWSQHNRLMLSWMMAAPVPSAEDAMDGLGPRLVGRLQERLKPYTATSPDWLKTNHTVFWQGLPSLLPIVSPMKSGGNEFIVATAAGFMTSTNPPPAELFEQFQDRDDILHYHWEVTQHRLGQWRQLYRLASLLSSRDSGQERDSALQWANAITPLLGNTVTEISQPAPREIRFLRRSHVGLTGFELNALIQWMADPEFPKQGLRLPFQPLRKIQKPALPKKQK